MRFLAWLLIASMAADITSMISSLWIRSADVNSISWNLYVVISIICIILFYKPLFPARFKNMFLITMILLLLIYLYYFFTRDLSTHDRSTPSNIVFTVLPILFFFKMIREMPTIHIQRFPMFWINAGFLIYFSGAVILYMISDYLVRVLNNDRTSYWIFHNFLGVVKYILFAIGLWQVNLRPKSL